jgi:hypothetical protein
MNRVTTVLVAASLAVSGMAYAQNAGNGSNTGLTTGVAPGNSSGAVTPGIGPSGGSPVVGNTAAGGGMAPTTTPMGAAPAAGMTGDQRQTTGTAPASVATTGNPSRTTAAPVPGANSFTMGQARSRLRRSGYTQISGLHKDNKGIWRAKATKNGQPMSVSLDYQGNVTGR